VAKLYQKASFYAFPTEFAEVDCISIKKAQAAGCFVVGTDFGAVGENTVFGSKVHSTKTKDNWNKPYQFHFGLEGEKEQKAWVDNMVKALKKHEKGNADFASWEETAQEWAKCFT
jgi:glycosyltransferase involved in cell wall biosynthesis